MRVGCAVAVARRGGLTATWDELNKYFGISGMPIASGQYWNGLHGWNGARREEIPFAEQDLEGMQQMRTLARNMVFLMRSIALGKEEYGAPRLKEQRVWTNFTR
jgi:multimeric flavodoxin WrbA